MYRIKYILLLLLVFSPPALAGKLLSETQFTDLYIKNATKQIKGLKVEKKASLEVSLETPKGLKTSSYLNNAYIEYKNSPDDLNDIINKYIATIKEMDRDDDEKYKPEQIVPVIKDYEYIRQIKELTANAEKKEESALVYEKLNEVLYVLYAFDTQNSIKFMSAGDLKDLKLKKSELRALSKKNLKRNISSLKIQGDPAFVSLIVADGTYEASFLLFDSLWTKKQFPVKGDIVVYVPSRDFVIITGSKDKEGLEKVRSIVYSPENEWSHVVAEVGFIRTGNKWKVFKP